MGTNCAPLVADLFLFCYERDFMFSLSDNNQTDITTLPVMVSYTPQFKHKTIKRLRLTLQNGATTD